MSRFLFINFNRKNFTSDSNAYRVEEERKRMRDMRVGEEEGERGPVLRVEGRIYIAPKSLNLVFGRVGSALTKPH